MAGRCGQSAQEVGRGGAARGVRRAPSGAGHGGTALAKNGAVSVLGLRQAGLIPGATGPQLCRAMQQHELQLAQAGPVVMRGGRQVSGFGVPATAQVWHHGSCQSRIGRPPIPYRSARTGLLHRMHRRGLVCSSASAPSPAAPWLGRFTASPLHRFAGPLLRGPGASVQIPASAPHPALLRRLSHNSGTPGHGWRARAAASPVRPGRAPARA